MKRKNWNEKYFEFHIFELERTYAKDAISGSK